MLCKSCRSVNQSGFSAETCIHFSGLKGLDLPVVFVFPKIMVCLDCGFSEFSMPATQLRFLAEGLCPNSGSTNGA